MAQEETFFDSRAAILAAIPHRPPFLFVDEVLTWTDSEIVCAYRFKENEFFFEGHYPGAPIVPGVILCESAMQAGAIFATKIFRDEERSPDKMPVVGRMTDVKFKRIVRPGERVEQHISFKERMGSAYYLRAKVLCDGKLAVSFEFAVTTTERPKDFDVA